MELRLSSDYEEIAVAWQYQLITILKQKMEQYGVEEEKAKEVVGDFIFDLSMLHDQGEITVNGQPYNPRIGFYDFAENLISIDEQTNLQQYALGSLSEAYGD